MSADRRPRIPAAVLTAAALLMVPVAPASAAPAVQGFDAPIFGTSASRVAAAMPRVVDVACSHDACTTGVLPAPVMVESTRYFSTTVAPGGAFAAAPGFKAKVMRSWTHSDDADDASFTVMLIEFAKGTSLDVVVAAEAAARGLALSGPTTVNGLTTWTATGSEGTGIVGRYSYSVSGSKLAYGRCVMTESLATVGACAEQNVAVLASAAATRAVPTSVRMSPEARALIPATPKGLVGVVATQQLSANLLEVANPSYTSAPRVARQLAGTLSVDLEYRITGQPGLYVIAQIAPVDTAASRAAVGRGCPAAEDWCTSAALRGTGVGHIERIAFASDPQAPVGLTARWNGAGRWLSVSCNLTDYTPLTTAQTRACSTALKALVNSARQG